MLIPFGVFSAGVSSGGVVAGSFDLLETALVSSNVTSVTFNTSTYAALGYKHLQIRATARDNRAGNISNPYLTINSDTGSTYSYHNLNGNGSSVTSAGYASTSGYIGSYAGGNIGSNIFGALVIDFLDVFSSTKYKTFRSLSGATGAANNIGLWSANWRNTAAVTAITINADPGSSFVSGSRFSIYGLKG